MRVLIAILSCAKDRPLEDAHRESCMGDLCDYRYFLGGYPAPPRYATARDEVWFEKVGDDYASLPFKTQEICRYALGLGYDYIFKADVNTYIHVPRLLRTNYWKHDYIGFYRGNHEIPGGYASGGSGYWLSRRAMEIVANTEMQLDYIDGERGYVRGEDLQVGRALFANGIVCHWSEAYRLDDQYPAPWNSIITNHDVRNPNNGPQMRKMHEQVLVAFEKGRQ